VRHLNFSLALVGAIVFIFQLFDGDFLMKTRNLKAAVIASTALSAALVAGTALANPFVSQHGASLVKVSDASCGANMKKSDSSCGANMKKSDSSCGANMKKSDSSCGANMKK
jgi:hypothetical protein